MALLHLIVSPCVGIKLKLRTALIQTLFISLWNKQGQRFTHKQSVLWAAAATVVAEERCGPSANEALISRVVIIGFEDPAASLSIFNAQCKL